MIKRSLQVFLFLYLHSGLFAQNVQWKPVQGKIMSPWAEKVNPNNPLPEYPRPQMVRENNWQNLNGLWDYSLSAADQKNFPSASDGKILVPYPLESALSGVGKIAGKDKVLWYKKTVKLSPKLRNKKLLLHFGAVDWESTIFVNGKKAGEHQGGYDPFTIDISSYLKPGADQEIVVRVFDPTNDGYQAVGKQNKKPHGIWYTSVTGIWQTVWLEAVPDSYILKTVQTPDIDQNKLNVQVNLNTSKPGDQVLVSAWEKGTKISEVKVSPAAEASLPIPSAKLWSPSNPFLYDLKVSVVRNGKVIDEVKSYFAMRKISMSKDQHGIQRMLLNNSFLFQYGTLDQGWWPDGLYTAPSDEALRFDIEKTRDMGFNMIRKHVKVEPARWYYHCDRLGMLVWQDMPNGDIDGYQWEQRPGQISGTPLDKIRTPESENAFKTEWKGIMSSLHNFPSIVVWVPFNESWGQFKTEEVAKLTIDGDPSRLVNVASGGNYFPLGHIVDIHNYPDPVMPNPVVFGDKQILVLGEHGGLALPITGHTWLDKGNFGYQSFKNADELKEKYAAGIKKLSKLIPLGLSAAIYTQTTDVEIEINGLMTYDRKIIKIAPAELKELHKELFEFKAP